MPKTQAEQEAEEVARLLADPFWRLQNLYHIKSEDTGGVIPFRPYPEQMEVFKAVLLEGHKRIIIPKARRRGMSTAIDVLMMDQALQTAGFEAGIVDRNQADASKKLENIIKTSYENFPPVIKDSIKVLKNNDDRLSFQVDGDTSSHIYAATGYRGGNCNFLHVSEWGWIQCEDPRRSEEIQTGAIQAARKGQIIVETTWKGGKNGHLWDYTEQALTTPEEEKHPRSWRIMFFPWHTDPVYSLESNLKILPQCEEYFEELEQIHGIKLTMGQKRWYQDEAWPLHNNRFGEYPSTLEECFKSPMDGVIYEMEMARALSEKRVTRFPIEKGIPIFACFDLGRNDAMPITLIQPVGKELRIVGYYVNHRESIRHYGDWLKAWMVDNEVQDLRILLPHDGGRKSLETGKTLVEAFAEMGFSNVQHIPKIPSVWTGINYVKDTFQYLWFHKDACTKSHSRGNKKFPSLLECLENYHQAQNANGVMMSMEPVHDDYSHGCFDRYTFVSTKCGPKLIDEVAPGDLVHTPTGYSKVVDAGCTGVMDVYRYKFADGTEVECTADHPFFTEDGLQPIGDVLKNNPCTKIIKAQDTIERRRVTSKAPTKLMVNAKSIVLFGKTIMEKSLKVITSTISTKTQPTMQSGTFNASHQQSTTHCTRKRCGQNGHLWTKLADIVGKIFKQRHTAIVDSVAAHVTDTTLKVSTRRNTPEHAQFAHKPSWSQETPKQKPVHGGANKSKTPCPNTVKEPKNTGDSLWATIKRNVLCAELSSKLFDSTTDIAPHGVNHTTVLSCEFVGRKKVFNLKTDGDHCFYADGFLVSNCDSLRTFCEAWQRGLINRQVTRKTSDDFDDGFGTTGSGSKLAGSRMWGNRR